MSPRMHTAPDIRSLCSCAFIANRAAARLYHRNGEQPRWPLAFLTNGGGVTEARKAEQLTEWLGVRVTAEQVSASLPAVSSGCNPASLACIHTRDLRQH
jgi:hypothetical protein